MCFITFPVKNQPDGQFVLRSHSHWNAIYGGGFCKRGLIYACLAGMPAQEIIEFATAASCLKHSIEGDFNQVSVEEVLKLAQGDGSGRVQR